MVILFVIAAIGKSAQLGLHMWLPDAMEGPTPVSALIHAATMVTAGLLLLLHMPHLLQGCSRYMYLVAQVGAATALLAAAIGLEQFDIKRVIAYSTCSQLGYMFCAIGLSQFNLSFFHLVNHAYFKALLFLAAGSIIHAYNNEQDLRLINYNKVRPVRALMSIGSIGLCALLPASGAFSKEIIINFSNLLHPVLWIVLVTTAIITLEYSVGLLNSLRQFKGNNSSINSVSIRHNSTLLETFVLSVLAFATFLSG